MDVSGELACLSQLVEWMKNNNVESLSHEGAGVSIKLADPMRVYAEKDEFKGVAPVPAAFGDTDGAGVCSCGHSWLEHDVSGCFHGCSHDVCVSDAKQEPVDD